MRLRHPFYQLPVRIDAARLRLEADALPAEAWVRHPDGAPGNSAARLISAWGEENDAFHGQMLPTKWLDAMPYARQILAEFGVVWSRSRLMRLAPGADVPEHADINYQWHNRVRVHIPVATSPKVRFHCDGQSVNMAAGEAWIFDNWRRHHVENRAEEDRIHLVADTTGTHAFWQFACTEAPPPSQWPSLSFNPDHKAPLLTERALRSPIMPAAEAQLLAEDLAAELTAVPETPEALRRRERFGLLLEGFVQDWRQLCALHGVDGEASERFERLAAALRDAARPLSEGLTMRANGVSAMLVLEKRILQHLVVHDARSAPSARVHV